MYSTSATWRWGAWISVILGALNLLLLALFYFPPPRVNSVGLTTYQTIARVDIIGALLFSGGLALFLLGMQWGGYTQYVLVLSV